jgi:hypothetical protein
MSTFPDCWITIVPQRWCNREWLAKSEDCKIRRSLMVEPAHHQGSSSLTHYKTIMVTDQIYIGSLLNVLCWLCMIFNETILITIGGETEKPVTELAAYIAARTGPEDGFVCNDRAKQVVVIIYPTS